MSFKDQLAADAVNVFLNPNEFGEPVTYNGNSINAVVDVTKENEYGNTFVRRTGMSDLAEIAVLASDVPTPLAEDSVIIGTKNWQVARIIKSDNIIHVLELIGAEGVY